jgi:hypothetical protein
MPAAFTAFVPRRHADDGVGASSPWIVDVLVFEGETLVAVGRLPAAR